jgi:hypothetical protein
MSRSSLAFLIGLIGFIAYIGAAVALGDVVVHRHWLLQLAYYLVAGIVWVFPAKWLIVWAVKPQSR